MTKCRTCYFVTKCLVTKCLVTKCFVTKCLVTKCLVTKCLDTDNTVYRQLDTGQLDTRTIRHPICRRECYGRNKSLKETICFNHPQLYSFTKHPSLDKYAFHENQYQIFFNQGNKYSTKPFIQAVIVPHTFQKSLCHVTSTNVTCYIIII